LVTRAEDPLFGACSNALNGNGGIPRLDLMRDGFTYHGGAVAEVLAFDRQLDDAARQGIERYLAEKYSLRTVKMWQ
jgi:hypothetical protein